MNKKIKITIIIISILLLLIFITLPTIYINTIEIYNNQDDIIYDVCKSLKTELKDEGGKTVQDILKKCPSINCADNRIRIENNSKYIGGIIILFSLIVFGITVYNFIYEYGTFNTKIKIGVGIIIFLYYIIVGSIIVSKSVRCEQ